MNRKSFRIVTFFVLSLLPLASGVDLPDEHLLLRGDDPGQFDLVGIGRADLTIRGGEIHLTGRPLGYHATRRSYTRFELSFEWKYDRPEGMDAAAEARFRGNGGLLLHIDGPPMVWPRCIEMQLAQADPGALFPLGERADLDAVLDPDAQDAATRPVGAWNRAEVSCDGGTISCRINGKEVSRGRLAKPGQGRIGWQSEGTPIRLRDFRLREIR